MESAVNISVVIPTWNRAGLVERLLVSLDDARADFRYGETEILIIDSSRGSQKDAIAGSCSRHDAHYLEGPDSVRIKRNLGISSSKYEYVLFIDSDVTVCRNLLNVHAETFLDSSDAKLRGSFGITEFVGEMSILWRIIQYTTFVDSYSFAKRFPYQNWTIGNNVMLRKDSLTEAGMFEEVFPYKLGGDDLDLTYRITKAGYRIKSAPEAVTWHARDTWNSIAAVNDRTKRWGSMEYYLSRRHPEIFITGGIRTELFCAVLFLIALLSALFFGSLKPIASFGLVFILSHICIYLLDAHVSGKRNILYYFAAKLFEARYYFFHIVESLKHGSLDGFYKTMSFSFYQTRAMLERESRKLWILVCSLIAGGVFYLFL